MNSNVHYWFTPEGENVQKDIRAKETRLYREDGGVPSDDFNVYGCWWKDNAPALNVQTNTELGNSPKDQLFKLNGDRSESVNVIDKNPEVAAKLKKELERIVDNRYLQNMN